jgi:hypothetical protein
VAQRAKHRRIDVTSMARKTPGNQLDEELLARWIRQASELPGWVP